MLLGAALLLISVLAGAVAARAGAPLLLVFLLLGMLAGEDGPGGIAFNDYFSAYLIGNLALAVILFDGGLRTRIATFYVALRPAALLSTVGVVVTTVVTGFFASWALGLPLLEGLLIGAIVGSTDAAAVFSLLHARGMQLKERVAATLEIESGSNDPMAVFLTVSLIALLVAGAERPDVGMATNFVYQMGLGTIVGIAAGRGLAWLNNRLNLAAGLYPLLALAGGLLTFGATTVLGGSGFLAIYLAGVVLGNQRLHAGENILRVHDGMAWLSQIIMFLMLGLLATPSALLPEAGPALLVAAVLMIVARPLAVWLCLLPFSFPWREQAYIGWVGLRGAVPIILATFPLLAGLPNAQTYFNVAFVVVLVSLVLQGWTVSPLARAFRLEVPPQGEPLQSVELDGPWEANYRLVGYRIAPDAPAARTALAALPLPEGARLIALFRHGVQLSASVVRELLPGDYIYLLAPAESVGALTRTFAEPGPAPRLRERQFFGVFVLNGDALLDDVAAVYGFALPAGTSGQTVADYLAHCFGGRPVVGDRVRFDAVELTVREVRDGRVLKAGLAMVARGQRA
jgi:potassium/hydrogen antiporter